MEIRYTLTADDLRNWQRSVLFSRPRILLQFIMNCAAGPAFLLALFASFGGLNHFHGLPVLLIFYAVVAFRCWQSIHQFERGADQAFGALGEHQLIIAPDGFRERTSISDGYSSWKGITRVEVNQQHIYMHASGASTFILPLRAFADDAEAARFRDTLLNYWSAGRDQHGPDKLAFRLKP